MGNGVKMGCGGCFACVTRTSRYVYFYTPVFVLISVTFSQSQIKNTQMVENNACFN